MEGKRDTMRRWILSLIVVAVGLAAVMPLLSRQALGKVALVLALVVAGVMALHAAKSWTGAA